MLSLCQIMMLILMMGIFSHKKIGMKPPAPYSRPTVGFLVFSFFGLQCRTHESDVKLGTMATHWLPVLKKCKQNDAWAVGSEAMPLLTLQVFCRKLWTKFWLHLKLLGNLSLKFTPKCYQIWGEWVSSASK